MKLIINIPAYNEEEKLGDTIKRIPRHYDGIDEVLVQVIDDGSHDRTADVAREAGAELVFSHSTNRGIGKVFRTAVEHALENGADFMVNIDADGQFDPNDIEKIARPVIEGSVDMVSADRFSEHKAKNIPWVKDMLNRFAAKLIGFFMNADISDLTCGFRAYNRETLLKLNLPGDFTYTQETIIDALGKNLKIRWIPVHVTYFAERKSRVVRSIWRYVNNSFRIILRAVRDVRPMKFFGAPALLLIALSVLIFARFLVHYFESDYKVTPYLNYIFSASISFIVGIQLLIFAFIADMIKSNRCLSEDLLYMAKKEKYKK